MKWQIYLQLSYGRWYRNVGHNIQPRNILKEVFRRWRNSLDQIFLWHPAAKHPLSGNSFVIHEHFLSARAHDSKIQTELEFKNKVFPRKVSLEERELSTGTAHPRKMSEVMPAIFGIRFGFATNSGRNWLVRDGPIWPSFKLILSSITAARP